MSLLQKLAGLAGGIEHGIANAVHPQQQPVQHSQALQQLLGLTSQATTPQEAINTATQGGNGGQMLPRFIDAPPYMAGLGDQPSPEADLMSQAAINTATQFGGTNGNNSPFPHYEVDNNWGALAQPNRSMYAGPSFPMPPKPRR